MSLSETTPPIASTPVTFRFIDTSADLIALMDALREHPQIAIDTEADSMHHYREKVCLLQISAGGEHWIVDPLAEGTDLAPLIRLLEKKSLLLHGADYDLRMLGRSYGFRPEKITDTMLAAQLLGLPQIGLAAMVERVCGISLSKHGQRADWSVRPLPPDLLAYAVDDTRYLACVAEALAAELAAKGRVEWLEESCERLLTTTAEALDAENGSGSRLDDDAAWRIKGCRKIAGHPGALLRELWRWREELACRLDRPPFRVAPNELLVAWANWLADNPAATPEQIPDRPAWLRGGRLEGFEQAALRALAMPRAEWPRPPQKNSYGRRLTPEDEERLKRLLKARDAVAEEVGIQPGVIGSREAIKLVLFGETPDEQALRERTGLMCWQARLLAPALLPLLADSPPFNP